MGGGNALSYAARHRDRDLGAFAAVINHTGSVCISDVYANNPPSATCSAVHPNPTQANMRDTFGAPPPSFAYQRSSLIDLDANGQLIAGGRHMAVNLADVPVRTHYSALDTIGYLREQSIAFDGFLRPRPEMSSSLIVETQSVCPSSSCNSPSEHCWDILDATASCDWLSLHTLEAAPPRGELLADRDARWGGLEVELHQQGSFGAATYDIASSPPTVQLLGRENLARVAVDLEAYGLDPNAGFDLVTSGADPLGTEFVFSDVSAPPVSGHARDGHRGACVPPPRWRQAPRLVLRRGDPPAADLGGRGRVGELANSLSKAGRASPPEDQGRAQRPTCPSASIVTEVSSASSWRLSPSASCIMGWFEMSWLKMNSTDSPGPSVDLPKGAVP
jgi:hypothetical protein